MHGLLRMVRHSFGVSTYEVSTTPLAPQDNTNTAPSSFCRSVSVDGGGSQKSLRSLCLWEGWESLEPRIASAIMEDVSSGSEPGPQSPYETRLTGEVCDDHRTTR